MNTVVKNQNRAVKILAIDDDPAALYATTRILKSAGYDVIQAVTGSAALAAAHEADMLILDINLPDMHGFELCRRLRADPDTARLPVLHLSATFMQTTDFALGSDAATNSYLTRPVEEPVLLATVRTLLARDRAARADAERSNLLQQDFLATLSHELRNPLNAILGWATILGRIAGLSPSVLRGVQAIERNSRIQARMITDLLDYAGITFGEKPLAITTVDPYSVVRAALDEVISSATVKHIELKTSFDNECLIVEADAVRLQQVALHLLSNAIKFSPDGSSVEIAASRSGKNFSLVVADHGKGIGEAFLPRIFGRFDQQDSSGNKGPGGLGLGLAIVKRLVDLHAGSIVVASEGEGKGAQFTVCIPLSEKLLTLTAGEN